MKRLILIALVLGFTAVALNAQNAVPVVQPVPVPPGNFAAPAAAQPPPPPPPPPVLPPVTPSPVPPRPLPVLPPTNPPIPVPPGTAPPVQTVPVVPPPVPFSPNFSVTVNGGKVGVQVPMIDNAKVEYTVKANGWAGKAVDVWLVMSTPFGHFTYDGTGPAAGWSYGFRAALASGPLADDKGTALDSVLPLGPYQVFLGLDRIANGRLEFGKLRYVDMADFSVVY